MLMRSQATGENTVPAVSIVMWHCWARKRRVSSTASGKIIGSPPVMTTCFAPAKHVVITGGEPMIFPEAVELTRRFRAQQCHITIETAGTVFSPVACDLMSISPKLQNSTPEGPWAAAHER